MFSFGVRFLVSDEEHSPWLKAINLSTAFLQDGKFVAQNFQRTCCCCVSLVGSLINA